MQDITRLLLPYFIWKKLSKQDNINNRCFYFRQFNKKGEAMYQRKFLLVDKLKFLKYIIKCINISTVFILLYNYYSNYMANVDPSRSITKINEKNWTLSFVKKFHLF